MVSVSGQKDMEAAQAECAGKKERSGLMDWMELRGNRLVVRLPAELDHHHTEVIRLEVDRLVTEHPVDELEFDFSETVFMDSAGIGMLIGRYKVMHALGGPVRVIHMDGQIRRILSLSGVGKLIHLEEEAV